MKDRHPTLKEASNFSELRYAIASRIRLLESPTIIRQTTSTSNTLVQLKRINDLLFDIEKNDPSSSNALTLLNNMKTLDPLVQDAISKTQQLVKIRNEERLSQIKEKQHEHMKEIIVNIETNKLINKLEKRIAIEDELKTQYPTLHKQIKEQIGNLWDEIQLAILIKDTGGKFLNESLQECIDKFDSWKSSIPPEKKQISREVKDWIQNELETEIENIKRDQLRQLQKEHRSLDIVEIKSDTSSMDATATSRAQEIQKFLEYLDSWFELPGISKEDFLINLRILNDNIPSARKKKRGGDEVISRIIAQIESGQLPKAEIKQHITESVSVNQSKREIVIHALKTQANILLAQHHIDKRSLSLQVESRDSKMPSVIAEEQVRVINKLVSKLESRFDPVADAEQQIADQRLVQDLTQLKADIHTIANGNSATEKVISGLISTASKDLNKTKQVKIPVITHNPVIDNLLNQLKSRVNAEKDLASTYPNWDQSVEAQALKAFIEIMEEDRLLPKGKVEHQLRSSIKAFDEWKKNSASQQNKYDLADQSENKSEAVLSTTRTTVKRALMGEVDRLMNEYDLKEASLSGDKNGPTLLVPKEGSKKRPDQVLEGVINRIMEIHALVHEIEKNNDVSSNKLFIALNQLKEKMHSTSTIGRLVGGTVSGKEEIQNIINFVKQNDLKATEIPTNKAAFQAASEQKQPLPQKPGKEKIPDYSRMNYEALAKTFTNRLKAAGMQNPFIGKNKRKERVVEALWKFVEHPNSDPKKIENQLRSTLREWDSLENESVKSIKKSSTTPKDTTLISEDKRAVVTSLLTKERFDLMLRYGLTAEPAGLSNLDSAELCIFIQHDPKVQRTNKEKEIAIGRLMEIDGLRLELESDRDMSEKELHDALTDLKNKMHNTGLGIVSSMSATAIQQIIKMVDKPESKVEITPSREAFVKRPDDIREEKQDYYSLINYKELAAIFKTRFDEAHGPNEENPLHGNWPNDPIFEALLQAVLNPYTLSISPEEKLKIENQLRSALRKLDNLSKNPLKEKGQEFFEEAFHKSVADEPSDRKHNTDDDIEEPEQQRISVSEVTAKGKEVEEARGEETKDYAIMNAAELIAALKSRVDSIEEKNEEKNLPKEGSHEAKVLEVMLNDSMYAINYALLDPEKVVLSNEDPATIKIIENQLRSSLRALDKRLAPPNQASILTLQEGQTEIPQATKETIIKELRAEIERVKKHHDLDYKTIRDESLAEGIKEINAIVQLKYDKKHDKTAEIVITRMMDIDNFIVELNNTKVSKESLRAGLEVLKDKMHSTTGKRESTGKGKIEDIMNKYLKVTAEAKQSRTESKEIKDVAMSAETVHAVAKLLVAERDSIVKTYGLEQKHDSVYYEIKIESENSQAALQKVNDITEMHLEFESSASEKKPITSHQLQSKLKSLKTVTLPEMKQENKTTFQFSIFKSARKSNLDQAIALVTKEELEKGKKQVLPSTINKPHSSGK